MAPKMDHTGHASSYTMPTPATIGHGSSHGQHQKQPRIDQPSNGSTVGAARSTNQMNSAGGNACRNPSGAQKANEGVDDADGAEADDEDDDEGDGDVLAPSGCAFGKQANQAGHLVVGGEKQTACEQKRENGIGRLGNSLRRSERTKTSIPNLINQSEDCDSDDEAYNGVDDISDSCEDRSGVQKRERKNIIALEKDGHYIKGRATASRAMSETSDTWEGFDSQGGLFMSDIPYFDEQYGRTDPGVLNSDLELFHATSVFDALEPMPPLPQSPSPLARRVRFREPVHPPSDSSDIVSNDEDLNCLFNVNTQSEMEATQFPPFCSQEKGQDDDDSSGGNSSGYETDYGDTTDEEDIPKSATKRPQSLLRQPSLSSLEAGTQTPQVTASGGPSASPFKMPTPPARHRPGPRLGTFKTNPNKPFAMIDGTGDNIVITPAKRPPRANSSFGQVPTTRTSTANASPVLSQATLTSAFNGSEVDFSDYSSHINVDPMLAHGSRSMAGMLLPAGPTDQGQHEFDAFNSVFFPMDAMGDVNALYAADDQDDGDNDEDLLDVGDFIIFSDDSSGGGDKALDTALPTPISTSPTGVSAHVQPKTPSPTGSSTNDLIAHFDKGVIGAFRHGQSQHQQQGHRPHSALSLNRHAYKSGRHAPANSPVSPPKKRKMSGGFAPAGSYGPFAKRKLMTH